MARPTWSDWKSAGPTEAAARERIAELREFFETANSSFRQMSGLPLAALRRVFALGRGLRRLVGRKG